METGKIDDFIRGWFIGDFEPSLLSTKDFEVALIRHYEGEEIVSHYHKVATEYNVLISGSMVINDRRTFEGDVFVFRPGETVHAIVLEDSKVLCVKVPSVIGDKYEVEK